MRSLIIKSRSTKSLIGLRSISGTSFRKKIRKLKMIIMAFLGIVNIIAA